MFSDIKIYDEYKCISIPCSLPYSWNNQGVVIKSNATTSNFDDVVASLPLEEMRQKTMDSWIMDSLSVRGHPQDRNKIILPRGI